MLTQQRLTWAFIVAAAAAAAVVLSACGGSSKDATVSAQCGAFDQFDSYRYSIGVKMQLPDLQADAPALGTYAGSLATLLSDFKIDGAYVAPDSRQALLDFKGAQVELRDVDGQRWERLGTDWAPLPQDAPTTNDLAPQQVCSDLVAALAPGLAATDEDEAEVNGIASRHYASNEADIQGLKTLLGLDAGTELPEQFAVEAWFASDGDWPVRLTMKSQTTDSMGTPATVEFVMELRDVNDAAIVIESPVPAGG